MGRLHDRVIPNNEPHPIGFVRCAIGHRPGWHDPSWNCVEPPLPEVSVAVEHPDGSITEYESHVDIIDDPWTDTPDPHDFDPVGPGWLRRLLERFRP